MWNGVLNDFYKDFERFLRAAYRILLLPLVLSALFVLSAINAFAQNDIAFSRDLPEATITAQNIPHIAYNNKVVSIADFEINDMGIYILAHRIRNYSLLHLSFDFDTIAEINLPRKFDKLYKDVYNQIHVVCQDSVYWVGTMKRSDEIAGIALMMGIRKDQFDYIHKHVSAATDKVIITHLYANGNQELYYFDIGGCD